MGLEAGLGGGRIGHHVADDETLVLGQLQLLRQRFARLFHRDPETHVLRRRAGEAGRPPEPNGTFGNPNPTPF